MIARIKNFAPLRLCGKYFSPPRSLNDYATHIPILIGLARIRKIRSVLEFGCGYYSTLTFLNRSAFPHLQRLQSIENDASWAETLHDVARNDQRSILTVVDGEIADSVSGLDLESFDLILIDDSKNSAQRASTIRAIASRRPERSWIAIHDFEVDEYRNAASGFTQRYVFKAYNPQTGVVCNSPTQASWKSVDRVIKEKRKSFEADQVRAWIEAFNNL